MRTPGQVLWIRSQLNCPKDEELELYLLNPKIQDSFEMLNNSCCKPRTDPLPSISNTSVHTTHSSVLHVMFPTLSSTHQHIKAHGASQHPMAGSLQATSERQHFDH